MNLFQRYRRLSIWNRLGAWGSVASIVSIPLAILLAGISVALPFVVSGSSDRPTLDKAKLTDSTPHQDKDRRQGKAPVVTFRDGHKAAVQFSLTSHVEPKDVPLVVVTCGDADKARDSLEGKVLSSVIAALETKTLSEARQSRAELEGNLMECLSPSFRKVGLTLDSFSLREFREVQ